MTTLDNINGHLFGDEAERHLRLAVLALENIQDSVIIHDADGRMLYFNDVAATSLGYTPEEFAALPPWGFAADMAWEERENRMKEIRRQGTQCFLTEQMTLDGRRVVQEVTSRYVPTDGGAVFVAITRDATERVRAQEVLRHLAFHDPLTGLANRALFDDRLDQAVAGARRHANILGLAFIDVDDFKDVNDEFGHEVGDRVLVALGERLQNAVRDEDTVARLGGDEFVIIFPRLGSPEDLDRIALKLRECLTEPVALGQVVISLSASLGLAIFDPDHDDARSLLMRADIGMYNTKRAKSKLLPKK